MAVMFKNWKFTNHTPEYVSAQLFLNGQLSSSYPQVPPHGSLSAPVANKQDINSAAVAVVAANGGATGAASCMPGKYMSEVDSHFFVDAAPTHYHVDVVPLGCS